MKKLKQSLRNWIKNIAERLPVLRKKHDDEVFALTIRLGEQQSVLRALVRYIMEDLAREEKREIGKTRAVANIKTHIMSAMQFIVEDSKKHADM